MAPSALPSDPFSDSIVETQESEVAPPSLEGSAAVSVMPSSPPTKPIHSLVLDTGPLIKGDPAISTLLSQAEELYTIPAVLSEIRDEQTRQRINTTLLPFLKLRSPKPESVKFVTDFARRTGDLEVLSRPDIHLIALTYELEMERNDGDWRLRKEPNQKRVNGSAPKKENAAAEPSDTEAQEYPQTERGCVPEAAVQTQPDIAEICASDGPQDYSATVGDLQELTTASEMPANSALSEEDPKSPANGGQYVKRPEGSSDDIDSDGDGDGEWITPTNIKNHRAKNNPSLANPQPMQRILQACMLTADFAMQNVAIRINLNVVSPAIARITHLKSWVLRCHGCFAVTRKMDKQFCPSCGQSTLTRTSCSTDAAGNFRIHLKRNFQWNNRGNVFSIPKPVHGNASGKVSSQGGGKNGWGKELILAEDQKEYSRKVEDDRRTRYRDLMDEDYLPSILTGERTGGHGRIKVSAGRNVNGKKRR